MYLRQARSRSSKVLQERASEIKGTQASSHKQESGAQFVVVFAIPEEVSTRIARRVQHRIAIERARAPAACAWIEENTVENIPFQREAGVM